jgi:hypothetical protein
MPKFSERGTLMRLRICTAFAAVFVLLTGTARAQIFSGMITATGSQVASSSDSTTCTFARWDYTFDTEITVSPGGAVLGRFAIVNTVSPMLCGTSNATSGGTFDKGVRVLSASSLSALAAMSIIDIREEGPAGPIYITATRSGDTMSATISGTLGAGYVKLSSPTLSSTFTGSVSGAGTLKRKSCYEVGALQPLQGAGGRTEIVTPASCDCAVSNLPAWFTPVAPLVSGELKRFGFTFSENTGEAARDWGAQLTCGTESYPVNYSQARKGKYRPPTPRSPTNGVRGEPRR